MTSLPTNNDFLNQASNNDDSGKETTKRKRRTALEIEMEKYPEYYALCEYDRRCLVANNYWRVMYGMPIIEVPPSDTHYYKYFDKKCYDRYSEYQKQKKREAEYNNMLLNYRKQTETKLINDENIEQNGDVVVEDKIIETKDNVVIKREEEMPIEENKNFLNEKQEHPIYPKPEKKVEIKKEPVTEIKKEVSEKKNSKKDKGSDKNNNEQISLF